MLAKSTLLTFERHVATLTLCPASSLLTLLGDFSPPGFLLSEAGPLR